MDYSRLTQLVKCLVCYLNGLKVSNYVFVMLCCVSNLKANTAKFQNEKHMWQHGGMNKDEANFATDWAKHINIMDSWAKYYSLEILILVKTVAVKWPEWIVVSLQKLQNFKIASTVIKRFSYFATFQKSFHNMFHKPFPKLINNRSII